MLEDIDVSKPVPLSFMVKEVGGKQFLQNVEIPKLPAICIHCKIVGHEIIQYRRLKKVLQTMETQREVTENEGFVTVNHKGRLYQGTTVGNRPKEGNAAVGTNQSGPSQDVQIPINTRAEETINLGSQNEEGGVKVNQGEPNVVKETQIGL